MMWLAFVIAISVPFPWTSWTNLDTHIQDGSANEIEIHNKQCDSFTAVRRVISDTSTENVWVIWTNSKGSKIATMAIIKGQPTKEILSGPSNTTFHLTAEAYGEKHENICHIIAE